MSPPQIADMRARAVPRIANRWPVPVLLLALSAAAYAQRGFRALQGDPPINNIPYDGRFIFARLKYTTGPGGYYYMGLPAWAHGYANAEQNLLKIVHAVSLVSSHLDGTNVIAIDDPQLFRYPVAYMTEAGYWVMSDAEAVALRKYLLKGGFLILDDTRDNRGNFASGIIEANFKRVFPELHFIDLTPAHKIFHSFFDIPSFDVVRQYYDRGPPVFRAMFANNDSSKRMMVLLNFNTDVSNFWEFSASGFEVVDGSNEAYKLGVNYLIYSLTH